MKFLLTLIWALPAMATYSNPVFWEDLADIDIFRVDDVFYYSASSMHYSPGAPILRSYDLINWEFVGHSVPTLDFLDSPAYNLSDGEQAYVKGIWASFLRYRESNGLFYWGGCIEFSKSYIYTSTAVDGTWEQASEIDNCYYDAGLLIDDDDTMYVSYGSTTINVAQLSTDGLSEVSTQAVYNSTVGYIEGSRFYRINDVYYILVTQPSASEYVLKSTNGPFGPYDIQPLVVAVDSPVSGTGSPHQGGIVDTPSGDWYYMAFVDAYPGGRIPVLAPVTFDSDGWPVVTLVNGAWNSSYDSPAISTSSSVAAPTGTDYFSGATLGANWEWNHNPDTSRFTLGDGLVLQTASVTDDLYAARNTLTHRILGPASTATILLDSSDMADGDRAGLALLRDNSSWVGIQMNDGAATVTIVDGITMNQTDWTTLTTGNVVSSASVESGQIWLRATADINPGDNAAVTFLYSIDGETFTDIGNFTMDTTWEFFMGYRFGIFNYATVALGGAVTVSSFDLALS